MAIPQSTRAMGAIRTSVLLEVNLVDQLQVALPQPVVVSVERFCQTGSRRLSDMFIHGRRGGSSRRGAQVCERQRFYHRQRVPIGNPDNLVQNSLAFLSEWCYNRWVGRLAVAGPMPGKGRFREASIYERSGNFRSDGFPRGKYHRDHLSPIPGGIDECVGGWSDQHFDRHAPGTDD